VVFGADSTTTLFVAGRGPQAVGCEHHFNFAQKIFQIGDDSTLRMTMWGLGNLLNVSYRTLIAQFADRLTSHGVSSMQDVVERWAKFFWSAYSRELAHTIARASELDQKPARGQSEEEELLLLKNAFSGGFCIGGYLLADRTPGAFEISYDLTMNAPEINPLGMGSTRFWGCPNLINRLIYGLDDGVFASILQSGKWTGTDKELFELLMPHCLGQPFDLPIREAIDWVHASIYTTMKTMKFSHMAPVCGGPVEVAVITSDRKFRWVRHKRFDAAIGEGGLFDVYRDAR
jgi:hypothetical protein